MKSFSAIIRGTALLLALSACTGPLKGSPGRSWTGAEILGIVADEDDKAVSGAYVYAYGPERPNILGPSDAMSEPTGTNGEYSLILPAGEYTVVARKRQSGLISGPMKPGDLSGKHPEKVSVPEGGVMRASITLRPFSQGSGGDPKRVLLTGTRIEGVVIDVNGVPVKGAYAFAFSGSFRQATPDYMSGPTLEDGGFRLSLPAGGKYTVGARTGIKGKPAPGDLFGFLDGSGSSRDIMGDSVTTGVTIVISPYGDQQ
jgi:hypothetical protein